MGPSGQAGGCEGLRRSAPAAGRFAGGTMDSKGKLEAARKAFPALFYGVPALFVILFPLAAGFDSNINNIILLIEIYMMLALGLNVVVGFTGLLDLGFVTFMAVGAVFTCLLLVWTVDPATGEWLFPMRKTEIASGRHPMVFEFSFFLILLLSGGACALLGVLRGIPTLRLSGDYYAIVTLGIAEIIFLFLLNEDWISGGAFGVTLKMESMPELLGSKMYWDSPQFYYTTLAVLAGGVAVMHRLQDSRLGRAWAAIRLDETAARSCGVNVSAYKLIAFAVSGFAGGVGGSFYALWQGTVAVRSLEVWESILILCCIVLGGMGSIRGVLLGTAILVFIGEAPRYELVGIKVPPEARFLIYGILIILLMRFRPQGLIPLKPGKAGVGPADLARSRSESTPLFEIGDRT